MKRLIIFLLLFAAIKVAGQTIGHLRFDTVIVYKIGGPGELAIMNSTKDSLGLLTNYGNGRTRFIKSRAINDSTIVVGLDTMTIRGTGGDLSQKLDSIHIYTASDPDPDTLYQYKNDDSTLVGYIQKGGGNSGSITTIVRPPQIVHPGDSAMGIPDTLTVIYDTATIGIRTTGPNDSALTVNTANISTVQRLIDTAAAIRGDFPEPGIGSQNLQQVLIEGSTLTQDNTINGSNFTLRYQGGTLNADSFKISAITSFGTPASIYGFGDSFMEGYDLLVRDSPFVYRTGVRYGIPVTNYGVSARGIWRADSIHNYRVNPGHAVTSFIWAGFNDIRRGGINNDTTYRKIITGLKSIIANQFLKTYVAAGTTGQGVTRHGSWTTTYMAASVGGKSSGNGAYTQLNNDSIVYVFPAADSTVVIATINGDNHAAGYNMGDFEIHLDGVLHTTTNGLNADGISDGANDNARSPNAFIITGLDYNIHRVTLINKSANYLAVDYFGHLVDKSQAMPLLIAHAPYNTVAGFAVSPNKGSVAAMDKINAQIDSMVATTAVGWPIFVVETNNFLDTLTGLASDQIHPNNVGDLQITDAVMDALPNVSSNGTDGTIRFNGGNFIGTANSITRVIPWRDEVLLKSDTSNVILNQSSYDQNAGFRIIKPSIIGNKLTVGSTGLANGADQLDIITYSNANHIRILGFSNQNYLQSVNSTNTTGVPFNFGAAAINFGQISGGATTVFATFDNTATNKFTVTGNALINSTVRLGTSLSPVNAAVTVGTTSNLPYLSFYRSTAATDSKIWDAVVANDTVMLYRVVTDNFLTPDTSYYVQRFGADATRIVIPNATLSVGRYNQGAAGYGLYIGRRVKANVDSIETVTSIGSDWVQVLGTDGAYKKITAANLGAGGGITSINSETGPAIGITSANGIGIATTTNTITATLGGTLNQATQILGASQNLTLGTGGSKLSAFAVNSATASVVSDGRINLHGNIAYLAESITGDANATVSANTGIVELNTASLSTDRTLTLPSATTHGQVLTIVVRFASSGFHFDLASAIQNNATGSNVTQLSWGTTYKLMVNASLNWMIIEID